MADQTSSAPGFPGYPTGPGPTAAPGGGYPYGNFGAGPGYPSPALGPAPQGGFRGYWQPGQSSNFGFQQPAGSTDFGYSSIGRQALEQNPNVAFYRYGQQMGISDPNQSAFGRWFAAQYPRFAQGYGAATISHPFDANIQGYAQSLGGYGDWARQFAQIAPQIRGLDPASRGGGPTRWVPR